MLSRHLKIILLNLLIVQSPMVFSQSEAVNWPMNPKSGISFRSGTPKKVETTGIGALYVGAVISDENGNILFYTDGHTVWDKMNNPMPNGFGLLGQSNSGRVQICPKPGDPSRYFIFTTSSTPNFNQPNELARFSEVNICLNNGLGDVIVQTKNTPLTSVITAKAAVVQHANGIDYWVAFHGWNSNQFYCFKVTENGIDPTPVISSVGSVLSLSSNSTGDSGPMKFSPDGTKLGMVVGQYATIEIFDFDDETGVVTNPLKIPAIYRQNHLTPDYTYGFEFSPDSHKLYLTRTNACLLTQYDLSAGDENAVIQSRVILAGDTLQHNTLDFYYIYGLQLGLDGKVYAAWNDQDFSGISVIASPNESGLNSNYQHDIIHWENHTIAPHYFHHFPTFAASYFIGNPEIKNNFTCTSASIDFWLKINYRDQSKTIDQVQWNFDDPLSGALNLSQELRPTHTFVADGEHRIVCMITWSDNTTSILEQVVQIPEAIISGAMDFLPSNLILCDGTTVNLDAGTLGNVRWQDGSLRTEFMVSQPGKYWFETCLSGCILSDTTIVALETIKDPLGMDSTLCAGADPIVLSAAPYHVLEWQDKSNEQTYTVYNSGVYRATIQTPNCLIQDTIIVNFFEPPDVLPTNLVLCDESPVILDASTFGNVRWQDGSIGSSYTVDEPGKYWFEATFAYCTFRDSVSVFIEDLADPLGPDTTVCQPITLSAQPFSVMEWHDKSTAPSFTVTRSGTFWAIIQTPNCIIRDSVTIEFCDRVIFIPNVITPNGDQVNDTFEITGMEYDNCILKVYSREGQLRYESKHYKNNWGGDGLPSGVYYYLVDNTTTQESFKGWVQIIR